ncbi:MAG: polysaccharide deacetylase family protein [Ginsengibacter sp.]
MFYLVKTPSLLKKLYPECIWDVETSENFLYLTFDDGPHPEITQFVLETLEKYNAHATFFCIGDNVKQHFETYKKIIQSGHQAANHTFNHLNGWKVRDADYLEDIAMAADVIDSNLFRPPYGRITKFQLKALQRERFNLKTVMWSVLSGDFDKKVSGENCYLNVVKNSGPGSIVVFHDSAKAFTNLRYALPRVLEYFSLRNYQFKSIML